MAKTTLTPAEELKNAFAVFIDSITSTLENSAPLDEDEADEEGEELATPVREEVEALKVADLRSLAKEHGIEETKKAEILAAFEDLYDEEEEEDEDDVEDVEDEDEDEDEDDEDEEGEYDRDDLEDLDLKDLRKIAKEEGHSAADYKSMDSDAIIDLILGEDEDDEEDEDEEDEDDVEELDEDALAAMTHKELLGLAKELGVKVPKKHQTSNKANQKKLVDLILDSGDEE